MGKLYRFIDHAGWVFVEGNLDPARAVSNLRPASPREWLWYQFTTPRFSLVTFVLITIIVTLVRHSLWPA